MRFSFSILIALLASQISFAQLDFRKPVELPFTGDGSKARFGDIDGDGDNDVVFSTQRKSMLFVIFNDEGAFTRSRVLVDAPPGQYIDGAKVNAMVPFTLYDYDGDGVEDIITATYEDYETNKVHVFRSHSGEIEEYTTIDLTTTGFLANHIFCTDIKSNSLPDIIIRGDKTVILEMTEPGHFVETSYISNNDNWQTRAADVNNDGHLDILTLAYGDTKVGIIKSDEDGYFTGSESVSTSGAISSFAAADFNNDERTDLILCGDGFVKLLTKEENGSYTSKMIYTPNGSPYIVRAADVDNDGDMDVALDRVSFTELSLLINVGDNTFEALDVDLHHLVLNDLDFGDVDGDDYPELLPSSIAGNVEIFKRSEDDYSSFANFQFSANPSGYGVLADVDNDGKLDLAMAHTDARAVSISFGTGNKKMFGGPVFFPTELKPFKIASGDFNNDSFADIVYVSALDITTRIDVMWGGEDRNVVHEQINIPGTYPHPWMLDVGDFNNDGFDDFVSQINIFYGSANGTFTTGSIEVNPSIVYQAAGDFNADGFSDVVMGGYSDIRIKWGKPANEGTLVAGVSVPATSVETLDVGKLNDDNLDDIIYYDFPARLLKVLINNGDNTFTERSIHYATGGAAYAVADYDLDGIDEVALFENETGIVLSFYSFDGNEPEKIGTETLPPYLGIRIMVAGLLNKDDVPDIVFIGSNLPVSVMMSDVVVEPTIAAGNVQVTERTETTAKITFEPGDGNMRILSLREATAEYAEPVDNKFYLGSPIMDHGFDLGSENYILLAGEDTTVVVTGLKAATQYHYLLFEGDQNEKKTIVDYLTSTYASGSFFTKQQQIITFTVGDKMSGDDDFTLNATSSAGLPVTYELISGDVTLVDNVVSIHGPGPVTIKASQAGNDDFNEASAEATFCINPVKPVVTVTSVTLTSSSIANNTWYLDNEVIEGQTEQTFTPEVDGTYMVRVTFETCFSESDPIDFYLTGFGEISTGISISPNPATKKLFIKIDAAEVHTVQPSVIDITGRVQYIEVSARPGGLELNIENLTAGLYFLKVHSGVAFKFLKE